MAVTANATGNTTDGANFTSISHSYTDQWQTLGIAIDATPQHTALGYGLKDTHSLLYNLYGDAELSLNLDPQSVYDMQSAFYPAVNLEYGIPLHTRHNYTKGDWEMSTAAIASKDKQDMFIKDLATWINMTLAN